MKHIIDCDRFNEDNVLQEFQLLEIRIKAGKGNAWYKMDGSKLVVDSDDYIPAMLCTPQGKGIGYVVLDALMQEAQDMNADSIVFLGPTYALDSLLTRYAEDSGIEPEKKPDHLEKGFSDITLRFS